MELERTLKGAVAGAVAAAVWAAQQPFDKRAFESSYDDVELLGKIATRGPAWPAAGLALHIQNGATFGALYAHLRPFLPGPAVVRGVLASMFEHAALWPLVRLTDDHHPARRELPTLARNHRALAQATWRHLLFGVVLGEVERRLNPQDEFEPPAVPVDSNGHGNIEHAAVATA
jgi:hypothetical protein